MSGAKIYGAGNIKSYLQRQKLDHGRDAHTSIADQPHGHNRQAARIRRQMEHKAAKDAKP